LRNGHNGFVVWYDTTDAKGVLENVAKSPSELTTNEAPAPRITKPRMVFYRAFDTFSHRFFLGD
jgi:hypothetical protein